MSTAVRAVASGEVRVGYRASQSVMAPVGFSKRVRYKSLSDIYLMEHDSRVIPYKFFRQALCVVMLHATRGSDSSLTR